MWKANHHGQGRGIRQLHNFAMMALSHWVLGHHGQCGLGLTDWSYAAQTETPQQASSISGSSVSVHMQLIRILLCPSTRPYTRYRIESGRSTSRVHLITMQWYLDTTKSASTTDLLPKTKHLARSQARSHILLPGHHYMNRLSCSLQLQQKPKLTLLIMTWVLPLYITGQWCQKFGTFDF